MAKWSSAKYKEHFTKLLTIYQAVLYQLAADYDDLTITFTFNVGDNVKPKEKS